MKEPDKKRLSVTGRSVPVGEARRDRNTPIQPDARSGENARHARKARHRKDSGERAVGRADRTAHRLQVLLEVTCTDGQQHEQLRVIRQGVGRPSRKQSRRQPNPAERQKAAHEIARGTQPERLARLLSAVGHAQRLRILLVLLGGEATHGQLSKATGLKSGPLYYHLNELRAAGLIGPKLRDLYVLTQKGRRVLLAALAVDRLDR